MTSGKDSKLDQLSGEGNTQGLVQFISTVTESMNLAETIESERSTSVGETFMQRDYSQYAWSSRTLDRRIEFFKLCKCDNESSVNDAYKAISNELQGPGALLGYRAMHKKINQV